MSNPAKNEEIVKKFLASKIFDFEAFGRFVAENGASIAGDEGSAFGFVVGHYCIKYCIPPVVKLYEAVDSAEARAAVIGGG